MDTEKTNLLSDSKNKKNFQTDVSKGSTDRFGYEWGYYSKILPIYEEQFRRWTSTIEIKDWKDKTFIDVGCGMGRNSYWPLKFGAKSGVAIDVDKKSIKSSKITLKGLPIVIKQMSAYEINYENEFDIAFSIGVIHHLEFPQLAIKQMVKSVKHGGKVLIWVYGKENNKWIVSIFNPFRRYLFSTLPIKITHFLSLFPSFFLFAGLKLGFGKSEYSHLLRELTFYHMRSIVFDQMLPKIANYWSKETVVKLLSKAGLKDIKLVHVNDVSWSAIGTKV